jgi:DNA-directed RNA polymerase specialized sigma24 family protein
VSLPQHGLAARVELPNATGLGEDVDSTIQLATLVCHIQPVLSVYRLNSRDEECDQVDEREWLAERFEENRSHLRAVPYRMLGSISEADDAVQEAWLRLSRSDADAIENLEAWLTTVVARVCLNALRARESRREASLDEVHMPDPIIDRAVPDSAFLLDAVRVALSDQGG